MPCEGDPHRLCGLEGYVQDMLNRGVSAPSGQLSPALWLSGCTNATADPHSGVSNGGWTQPSLRLFLDFLESKGIRSLDIWSQPDREERGANPTTDVPCDWALDELRRWIKQTTSSLKSDSSLPDGRQSNLKTDDASVGSNWQLDVEHTTNTGRGLDLDGNTEPFDGNRRDDAEAETRRYGVELPAPLPPAGS